MAAAYTLCGWWIVLLSCIVMIFGCLEDEKIALLKLKDVINHQNGSVSHSWNDEEPDCCRWNGVTCEVFSKRIIKLSITPFNINPHNSSFSLSDEEWLLEASLFQPFEELKKLSIQYSSVKGLTGQLKLTKLQKLILSSNTISHVPLLGELPSLKHLDLHDNALSHGFEELTNLSNLEFLNLEGFNNYDGGGMIHPSIWTLTSLKILSLSSNGLNDSLPKGLCALTNLQELDLSQNEFDGVIPTCLSNLTSLQLLDLSKNQFSGTIPSNVFSSLKSLECVSLSNNYFDGFFSFSSFADNSKLEVFELQNLNPKLKVDTKWKHPIFQLKILRLSNCEVIPSFLLCQYDLRYVDFGGNGMTGELPSWLLTNNSRLESLSLGYNYFTGRFTLQMDSFNAYLIYLDVSMNQVAGEIPTFIGSILPNLTYLNMSGNAIEGSIPSSIENMSQLHSLDLSNNSLSGEIPVGLFTRCEVLFYLKLSNNKLEGNFLPKNMSKSSNLGYLYLDSNKFSGDLMHGQLENSRLSFRGVRLRVLDISNNSISGRCPDWISELSYLSTLVMSKNHFEGKLPVSFCNLTKLTFIDLSWNNFGGTLPLCINLLMLSNIHLQGNRFHGPLPTSLSKSSYLMTLDVRDNNFSGFIPTWISSLSYLVILLLKGNVFRGSIPSELCQMENLNILDFAANNLSGYVPPCLSHIPFGKNTFPDTILYDGFPTTKYGSYSYNNQLDITHYSEMFTELESSYLQEEVQLITKSMSEIYKGDILYSMSAIDLSFNKLTGSIPLDIGNWDMVHSLNLSYNHFNGSIPWTLSRLKALESLDLSHNMLSGEIPSQITDLNFLSVFSVAYNNLSGPTPTTTHQFTTFNANSYEGNPLLCGLPLDRSCNGPSLPPQHAKSFSELEQNDFSFKTTFFWGFFGSFVVSCIGTLVFFYFNTNVLDIFLGWIGVERVPLRSTVELPWQWNK